MSNLGHLFAPGRIGTLQLKNRLLQSAMGTNLANADGTISDAIVAFYAARAAGGAALLTMGAVGVSYPRGQVQTGQVGISDVRFLPGLTRITDAVHRNGGRISAQLHHGGLSAVCDMAAGRTIALPSMPQAIAGGAGMKDALLPEELALSPFGHGGVMPAFKEMDRQDIAQLIEDFAAAAARAVAAGFDAVEVHAAHSYILQCSPDVMPRQFALVKGCSQTKLLLENLTIGDTLVFRVATQGALGATPGVLWAAGHRRPGGPP